LPGFPHAELIIATPIYQQAMELLDNEEYLDRAGFYHASFFSAISGKLRVS